MKKLLIGLVFVASAAHAEFISGNELYDRLTAAETTKNIEGMFYIAGVHDAHFGRLVCTPNTVSLGQLTDIVKKALIQYPETRNYSADSLVTVAIGKVWPCQQEKKKSSV